jgi:hypothetical protein
MGELDYFEYYYDNILRNEKQVNAFLAKNPDYQCGSVQIIRKGPKAALSDFYDERYRVNSKPKTMSEIFEMCKAIKQAEKADRPVVAKDESKYLYNREAAEEWVKVAKENNWDLNESIKPLCEHLGLSLVVVAPVLQRYGFLEKRKPIEKVYKYSKEQVQVWWNDKLRDGLNVKQQAEKVGIHFLQLGRLFTQYEFQPKKEKKAKKTKRGRI